MHASRKPAYARALDNLDVKRYVALRAHAEAGEAFHTITLARRPENVERPARRFSVPQARPDYYCDAEAASDGAAGASQSLDPALFRRIPTLMLWSRGEAYADGSTAQRDQSEVRLTGCRLEEGARAPFFFSPHPPTACL